MRYTPPDIEQDFPLVKDIKSGSVIVWRGITLLLSNYGADEFINKILSLHDEKCKRVLAIEMCNGTLYGIPLTDPAKIVESV